MTPLEQAALRWFTLRRTEFGEAARNKLIRECKRKLMPERYKEERD
jgi:hypothetical protein